MMILSQDGMVAVNSDNVAMFEVKETETIPHEAQLMATMHTRRTTSISRPTTTSALRRSAQLWTAALCYWNT